jgi:hypothetical protein
MQSSICRECTIQVLRHRAIFRRHAQLNNSKPHATTIRVAGTGFSIA